MRHLAKVSIYNMKAIEYNLLKTVIKMLTERLPDLLVEYGFKHKNIQIAPSYPTDLTKIVKPSIIVRKVDTVQRKVGFGDIAGHYYDEADVFNEVKGRFHCIMVQFDVVTANNTDRELLKAIISEGIINRIQMQELNAIGLRDFTQENNPEVGVVKLDGECFITDLTDTNPTDTRYFGVIRQMFTVIQTIIPEYDEYVDLTKWIKQTYTITI